MSAKDQQRQEYGVIDAQAKSAACATADEFLACYQEVPRERYTLPGGRHVWLHGLTELEWQQWRNDCARDDEGRITDPYADAKMLVMMVRDDAGKRLFDANGVFKLAACFERHMQPIKAAMMRLNGTDLATQEAIAKNSGKTATSGS